ncbi:MAG: hypothetical protein R6V77_03935 [Candidatus Cloacimonadaceae bacterium]
MRLVQILLTLAFCFSLLNALEIPFSTVPVKTDENLITNLVRIDPDDKKAETLPTQVWLWHDEENFYAQVESVIDSTFMPGNFAQRDLDTKGDYLFLNIITNVQTKYAYHFSATPSGSLAEGTKDINQGSYYDWNSSYSYTTNQNDTLWTVVFKIPFKDMRFNAKPPYKWRFTLSRYHEKKREYYAVPYYKESNSKDFYDKAIDITMTHKIKGKQDWKFRPYFVKSYDLVNKTGTFDPENVGLDISFNPSTKTKLKLALNPDFTDVPPDDASNIYNEKYPTYYYENRFFFIEDIDAFGVDDQMFYTRNIVQPQVAVKFTGNHNKWNYGYLAAKDKKMSEDGEIINPDDFYQLASVINKGDKHRVIFSGASRMNDGYYNHFGRGYWNYEFLKDLFIGSSHLYSTKYVEGDSLNSEFNQQGMYSTINFNATPGNWDIYSSYQNLQKDVNLDMGYLYDTGLEGYDLGASWSLRPREKYLRSMYASLGGAYYNGLEPNRPFKYIGGSSMLLMNFLPKYTLMWTFYINREEYLGKEHDTWNVTFNPMLARWQAFNPALAVSIGKSLIYSLNQTKDYYYLRANASGRVGQSVIWSVIIYHYEYDYDKLNYIDSPIGPLPLLLDNSYQIANAKLIYNFSNKMTITNGLNLSSYERSSTHADVSFYSNFRYEFKKDWFLYLGYKTRQLQDEPSVQDDWMGHFRRNSASAYLKLSLTI